MVKTTLLKVALVVVFALQGAACTGPLSIEHRPCPCLDGYHCCNRTKQCLQPGETCEPFAIVVDQAIVRQGGSLKLTIIGPDLGELTNVQLGDLRIPDPIAPTNGVFELPIHTIPHGATLGPYDLQFTAGPGATPYQSASVITVSPIVVSSNGNDEGPGTTKQPFRTLEKALSPFILGPGDTLQVAAGTTVGRNGASRIPLPKGVTLRGEPNSDVLRVMDSLAAHVHGDILPLGNLMISNLDLDGRVVVTDPGSVVSLASIRSQGTDVGVHVYPEAAGASVVMTGAATSITSTYLPPVWVEAPDVHLKIWGVGEISNQAEFPALMLEGENADVDVRGARFSTKGGNVIFGSTSARVVMNDVQVRGIVALEGARTVAELFKANFNTAEVTTGGLRFRGESLTLQDCMFHLVSLVQSNRESRVMIRNTTFSDYLEPAVSLEAGDLDLGNAVSQGDNKFETTMTRSGPPPVALSVRAKTGTASVTMSTSRVNGRMPAAGWVMGPAKDEPYYQIENMVPIQMY